MRKILSSGFFLKKLKSSLTLCLYIKPDGRKRKRRAPLVLQKRRRRLLPYIAAEDPERRLQQMASLATALTSLKLEFSNELTYVPRMAPRYKNRASLEKGGMQVLCQLLCYCKSITINHISKKNLRFYKERF